MSPAILYFVTTTSSAIVGSASVTSGFSAIFGGLYRLLAFVIGAGNSTVKSLGAIIRTNRAHVLLCSAHAQTPFIVSGCWHPLVAHGRLDSIYLPKRVTTFTLILVTCTPTHSEHASVDGNSVANFTWLQVVASWHFTWQHFHCNQQFVYVQYFLNIRGCYDYPAHWLVTLMYQCQLPTSSLRPASIIFISIIFTFSIS